MKSYLTEPGVVGVGNIGNTIVFYVESDNVAQRLPMTYMGYNVAYKVTGKVRPL
jgi:hypothetical protein